MPELTFENIIKLTLLRFGIIKREEYSQIYIELAETEDENEYDGNFARYYAKWTNNLYLCEIINKKHSYYETWFECETDYADWFRKDDERFYISLIRM